MGYLLGAAVSTPLIGRIGPRQAFLAGLVITDAALAASAATTNYPTLLGLRLVTGAAGAVAFIAGAGMVAHVAASRPTRQAAVLVGLYVAGAGLGIVVSGLAIPALLDWFGRADVWRVGWLALAAVALVALAPAVAASRSLSSRPTTPSGAAAQAWPGRKLAPTVASYALFGTGYIAYMTFIIALLQNEHLSSAQISVFWAALGSATIGAVFLWAPVLARACGGHALALLLAVLAVGVAVPLLASGLITALVSGVLVGSAITSVVTAVTSIAQRNLPPHRWGPAIGGLTVSFALGQCAGPLLAGALSDRADGVRAGMVLSTALLVLGSAVALAQRGRTPLSHDDGKWQEHAGSDRTPSTSPARCRHTNHPGPPVS
jgi:MFS family permease